MALPALSPPFTSRYFPRNHKTLPSPEHGSARHIRSDSAASAVGQFDRRRWREQFCSRAARSARLSSEGQRVGGGFFERGV